MFCSMGGLVFESTGKGCWLERIVGSERTGVENMRRRHHFPRNLKVTC